MFTIGYCFKFKMPKKFQNTNILLHVDVHALGIELMMVACIAGGEATLPKKNQRAHMMYLLGGHGNYDTHAQLAHTHTHIVSTHSLTKSC